MSYIVVDIKQDDPTNTTKSTVFEYAQSFGLAVDDDASSTNIIDLATQEQEVHKRSC